MRVLVTGARGFIGSHVVAALASRGHQVVCAVRGGRERPGVAGVATVPCDMAADFDPDRWRPRLADVEAVVNVAGILRENGRDTFEAVHVRAPAALFDACLSAGVRRIVQVSALGHERDGEFIASKHRGDRALLALPLAATVLRPALVYSVHGSYGGTSLLRAMAALPGCIAVPGTARRPCLQPIAVEDVAAAVVAALEGPPPQAGEIVELAGPEALSLEDYLQAWRRWLGLPAARVWRVPGVLVGLACRLGERLGRGPLGTTMLRMLEHGNLAAPDALERQRARLGLAPRPLARALADAPAQVQDRWHARLYLALPLLRLAVAGLWLASGLVGWWLPADAVVAAAPAGALPTAAALALARGTATLDLALGAFLLFRWRPRLVLAAMLLGYTAGIGLLWPRHWLDPLGGLPKNLPLMAALLVLLATEERR